MTNGNFGSGNGTELNPYLVQDAKDLNAVRNNLSAHYKQTKDIDLTSYANWSPIGNSTDAFNGGYDGNGFEIKNLSINKPNEDAIGLFGFVGGGYLKNISMIDVDLIGRNSVAGIVAEVKKESQLEIDNCSVKGKLTGYSNVGGIAGQTYSTDFKSCKSEVILDSGYHTGGIVAIARAGSIDDCQVYKVTFTNAESSYNGGIVGTASASYSTPYDYIDETLEISKCYANINAYMSNDGRGFHIGGIVGQMFTKGITISDCYTTGIIDAHAYLGGIVGEMKYNCFVRNCHTAVDINCWGYNAGAIAGHGQDETVTIENSFLLSGSVVISNPTPNSNFGEVYGFFWRPFAPKVINVKKTDNFNFVYTPSIYYQPTSYATGVISDSQAKQKQTYIDAGWDFNKIWTIEEGKSYPTFKKKRAVITCKRVPLNNYRR